MEEFGKADSDLRLAIQINPQDKSVRNQYDFLKKTNKNK